MNQQGTEPRGPRTLLRSLAAAGALLLAGAAPASADGVTEQIAQAIEDGVIQLNFRYRYEFVDQDGKPEDANANTLRSRLTFAPGQVGDFGFLVEVDDLRHIGSAKFDDTRNDKTERPIVADPKGTDLNQALVRYTGFENTELVLGRQRINRGNQRFVGGVGWRQNEQTYDSLGVSYQFTEGFTADYAYVTQVNRVNGPEDPKVAGQPPADFDSSSHLFDLSYVFGPEATLTGYAYLLDFDNAELVSNATVGARLAGKVGVREGLSIPYAAEFAYQEDYGDNPTSYDANYYLLEAGLALEPVTLKLGYEVLEGGASSAEAFQTPLATGHAFQGWADKFLSTPGSGIEDLYLLVSGKVLGVTLSAIFHDFGAETGSGDLGSELDLAADYKIGKHYGVLLKYASYDADNFATDTDKFWLMLTAAF